MGGCHCLQLSHCLSDLPGVETLLSDHARRLGELSNFNVKVAIPPGIPGVPHPGKADDRCMLTLTGGKSLQRNGAQLPAMAGARKMSDDREQSQAPHGYMETRL